MTVRTLAWIAAMASAMCATAYPARADHAPRLALSTELVHATRPITEEQCLARARNALAQLFHTVESGPASCSAEDDRVVVGVECLNARGVNAAYISAASANALALKRVHDTLATAMQGE